MSFFEIEPMSAKHRGGYPVGGINVGGMPVGGYPVGGINVGGMSVGGGFLKKGEKGFEVQRLALSQARERKKREVDDYAHKILEIGEASNMKEAKKVAREHLKILEKEEKRDARVAKLAKDKPKAKKAKAAVVPREYLHREAKVKKPVYSVAEHYSKKAKKAKETVPSLSKQLTEQRKRVSLKNARAKNTDITPQMLVRLAAALDGVGLGVYDVETGDALGGNWWHSLVKGFELPFKAAAKVVPFVAPFL